MVAPARTSAEIVARINADAQRAVGTPEARDRLIADAHEPAGGSAEDFGRFICAEMAWYAKVAKVAGLRGE
jgi:tripartite-type tricarboxylate transporter receptor subunit TctC